jgi:hypothetical protein
MFQKILFPSLNPFQSKKFYLKHSNIHPNTPTSIQTLQHPSKHTNIHPTGVWMDLGVFGFWMDVGMLGWCAWMDVGVFGWMDLRHKIK